MANYGMLGLLEGVGKGMQGVGDTIKRNALLEAQAQRDMNLFNIKQRAAQGEWNRQHEILRGEQLEDQQTANAREDTIRDENRQNKVDDMQFAVDNRQPSAFSEKVSFYEQKLKSGDITQEQYNIAMGLTKPSAAGGLSQKDRLKMVNNLRSDYAKAMEIVPAKERQPFEAWAAQNQPETWAVLNNQSRTEGLLEGGVPVVPTGSTTPTEAQIDQLFANLMKEDPATWDENILKLREEGYEQAFKMLRARVQEYRRDQAKAERVERMTKQPQQSNSQPVQLSRTSGLQRAAQHGRELQQSGEMDKIKQRRKERMRNSFAPARPY